jgi:aspartate/methionine/tyrosine aminotransferase
MGRDMFELTSTMRRRIPAAGINLFQLIYRLINEYQATSGRAVLDLSLGNPDLVPDETIRQARGRQQVGTRHALHAYAEDKNLDGFCEGLARTFLDLDYSMFPHLAAVPIPGIKSATALLPLACGIHMRDRRECHVVTNAPAYDVMGTWVRYLASNRIVWPLSAEDNMTLNVPRLREVLRHAGVERPDMVFVIRPGNPAARGANEQEWRALIELCIERGIRLVNDGAYTTLARAGAHVPLASIAAQYRELEWAELFSVSKAFSDPGARLGMLIGSRELVEDFVLIKGNTDSGPVPSMMTAYAEVFADQERARAILAEVQRTYQERLDYVVPTLRNAGLRLACTPDAGFFTLWCVPDEVLGVDLRVESGRSGVRRAEVFNRLVIERTGIVGVHFSGPADNDEFIRYAVCTDLKDPVRRSRLEEMLTLLQPVYR